MLSVIIITKNEENNIERCLKSVQWADELIVLDSGSTDNTVSIAKKFTDKVYSNAEWQGYGVQKQRALNYASGKWILNLDADESVDETLKKQLLEIMVADEVDACRVPIQMYFYNQPLKYSWAPKRHVRLFKKEGAYFSEDIVHEKIVLPDCANIKQLDYPIAHHSFQDISHALYKINKYSSYTAHIRLQKKQSASLGKVIGATGWMFLRCYLLQKGFLDGKAGFLMAVFNAQGTFYRGMKQIYPDKVPIDQ